MNKQALDATRALCAFIAESPTANFAAHAVCRRLKAAGFTEYYEHSLPDVVLPGTCGYVMRGDSTVLAFRMPAEARGFSVLASHSDSPGFRLKSHNMQNAAGCTRLATERYGGMRMAGWFDRPLSLAGRAVVRQEGRFPAGDANLSTSVLYYDALISASYLAGELGLPRKVSSSYKVQAEKLRKAIERYFGAEVSGYETWRYYDGNNVLRSWICLPLVAGIDYHKEGTVDALLGPELMTENGVLTEQGDSTFWDRATLYALRGIFCAGYPDRASDVLHAFSERRLLGEHVPYPVEAWPEGSQRHLSAESGLYCRIITEGLFGIRPTGFDSFDLAVSMPSDWDRMALRHIRAFGRDFGIIVERTSSGKLAVTVPVHGGRTGRHIIAEGRSIRITLE